MSSYDDEFPFLAVSATAPATSSFGPAGTILASTVASDGIASSGVLTIEAVATEPVPDHFGSLRFTEPSAELPRLVIDVSSVEHRLLEQLAEIGLLGSSPDDVATYLVIRGLDDLVRAGVLKLTPDG